jgi:gamma-glutamyltranspeptidase
MIAAWQLTPSSRNRIADPALWPVDISPFVSKDTAKMRWQCFDPNAALTPAKISGDTLSCAKAAAPMQGRNDAAGDQPSQLHADELSQEDVALQERIDASDMCAQFHAKGVLCRAQGTTSFVVADGEGNAVAVTQTLGTWGGNFYVSPGLGFIYNDKLTSYSTDANGFGARMPFARHGSSLSPTLVTTGAGSDARAVLAIGAAGNAWINSAVYQGVVGVLDFGLTPQQALEQPRFLPSQRTASRGGTNAGEREFVIDIENGIDPGVLERLEAMGHHFNRISLRGELRMGYGAAIGIRGGSVSVGADPRRSGTAGAIP